MHDTHDSQGPTDDSQLRGCSCTFSSLNCKIHQGPSAYTRVFWWCWIVSGVFFPAKLMTMNPLQFEYVSQKNSSFEDSIISWLSNLLASNFVLPGAFIVLKPDKFRQQIVLTSLQKSCLSKRSAENCLKLHHQKWRRKTKKRKVYRFAFAHITINCYVSKMFFKIFRGQFPGSSKI